MDLMSKKVGSKLRGIKPNRQHNTHRTHHGSTWEAQTSVPVWC